MKNIEFQEHGKFVARFFNIIRIKGPICYGYLEK